MAILNIDTKIITIDVNNKVFVFGHKNKFPIKTHKIIKEHGRFSFTDWLKIIKKL